MITNTHYYNKRLLGLTKAISNNVGKFNFIYTFVTAIRLTRYFVIIKNMKYNTYNTGALHIEGKPDVITGEKTTLFYTEFITAITK